MTTPNYTDQVITDSYYEANQRGETQDPNSLYADYMKEEKARNIIEQINPDYLLEDIEHRIRGQLKDRMTQEWKESVVKTKVSELLITNYISFLGSILNQNTSLSNFSTQEINNIMDNIINYTKDDLSDNSEDYGFVKRKTITVNKTANMIIEYESDGMIMAKYKPIQIEQEIELERVTDYNEMNRIGNIICMSTFSVLKRAQNGMEAQRIFRQLNMSENINPTGSKGKALDFLKFWKG